MTRPGGSCSELEEVATDDPISGPGSSFNIRQVTADYMRRLEGRTVHRSLDIVGDVIDEVALEGLDGITLQGLWERLKYRPGFTMTISEQAKDYIWYSLKKSTGIQVYELPNPRPDLTAYNRNDYKDERGNLVEPLHIQDDIYIYTPIDDKKNHVRGSCPDYTRRTNITDIVRRFNYTKAFANYGNRLVFVASQSIREKAILPPDIESDLDMTIIQYCIIERVARARYPGEGTRGKISLGVLKIDPKALFYQRKLLLRKKIITKQSFTMKFGEGRFPSLISILHIPRFYAPIETVMSKNIKLTFDYLKQRLYYREEAAKMKHIFGKHTIKTILLPEYSEIFCQADACYAELHPEVVEKEKNPVKQETYRRKFMKVIILKKPDINFSQYCRQKLEEKEEIEIDQAALENKAYFRAENLSTQVTLTYRAHCHVINSGAKGSTLREIAEAENITNLDARTTCRFMVRLKFVSTVLEDIKRTKVHRYVWFKFKNANAIYQQLGSEAEKNFPPALVGTPAIPAPEDEEFTYWAMVDGSLTPQRMTLKGPSPVVTATELSTAEIGKSIKPKESLGRPPPPQFEVPAITPETTLPAKYVDEMINSSDEDDLDDESNLDMDDNESNIIDHHLRFSKGEGNDFIRIEGTEHMSFSYETAGGWGVLLEPADVRVTLGRNNTTFNSMKNVDRANLMLEMVYKQTLILGFQQILRGVRRHEATLKSKEEVDRRSLYRILKQLQNDKRIQVWRISVSNGSQTRVCSAFTPGDITENSPLLVKAVDSLIQSVVRTTKLTKEQKKQRQKKVSILRRTIAPPPPVVGITKEKAKRGPRKRKAIPTVNPRRRGPRNRKRTTPVETVDIEKKPRTPNYDEVDKQALSRMKGLRGDWTPEEDRHVLCLFISSVIFIPRYNLDRVFIFNAPQIRDIMHLRLEESRCKTQMSIRRRLHFLMKNKGFYARYRYYLNTALDDHELRSEILSQHEPQDGSGKIFYDIPTDALTKVFDYLMNLFTNSSSKFKLDEDIPVEMSSSEYQDLDQVQPDGDSDDDDDAGLEDFEATVTEEYQVSDEFYVENKNNGKEQITDVDGISGISVLRLRGRDPVIVDGNDDPRDKLSVDIWTARTSLLSLILSGETMSEATSFLDSITDEVLDFVVQNLRCLTITTITKPENRFTISAGMKRKLQSHVTTTIFRQCHDLLQDLRVGTKFECTQDMSIPALFVLTDFTIKKAMNFGIELPESVITVNEEWQDLFSALSSKDFELSPKKSKEPLAHVVEPVNAELGRHQSRKRNAKPYLVPGAVKVKRERIEEEIDNDNEELSKTLDLRTVKHEENEGFHEVSVPVKMERSESDRNLNYPPIEDGIISTIPERTDNRRKITTVEDILKFNDIFSKKRKRVVPTDDDCDSNSSSLRTLVLNSDSLPCSQNVSSEEDDDDESNSVPGTSTSDRIKKIRRTETHSKLGSRMRSTAECDIGGPDRDDYGEGEVGDADAEDLSDLDEDEAGDYIVTGQDSDSDNEVFEDKEKLEKNKAQAAKVAESLRMALMKLPKKPKRTRKLTTSKIDVNLLDDEIEENADDDDGTTEISRAKGRISNKTLRTLRTKINATQAESRMIEKDFFSVNLPKISVTFSTKIDDLLYNGPPPMSDILYLQNLLIKSVPTNCISSTLDPKEISGMGRYASLYDVIDLTEDVGVSIPYLLTKFDREFVSVGVQYLVNFNYVYMVGVLYRRFVAACHSHKWTMPVPTHQGLIYSERVIMRPWVTSLGCVNWPVIIQVFSTLIGCLNTNPSIRVRNLCKMVQPMLSSVETMILVEALAHMEFVKLYSLKVSHDATLFSAPAYVKKHTQMDEFLDMELLFIELKPYATAKFADLQEAIHPAESEGKAFPDVLAE